MDNMDNMDNRIIVRLDLDSVLNDLSDYWREMHKDATGEDIDFTEWGVHKLSAHGKDIYSYFQDKDFFLNAPVKEGAKRTIQMLEKSSHVFSYKIVSSCTQVDEGMGGEAFEYINQQKIQWCGENLTDTAVMNFILVGGDKSIFKGDIIVDDKPDNLIDQKPIRTCLKILFDASYNTDISIEDLEDRDTDNDSHFTKVKSHEELQYIFNEILKAQSVENYLENK